MKLKSQKEVDQEYLTMIESVQSLEETVMNSCYASNGLVHKDHVAQATVIRNAGTEARKALRVLWENAREVLAENTIGS